MEAKRRAQAAAKGLGPEILVVDREHIGLETGSAIPSRPATRGSRRAADGISRAGSTEHRVRIQDGSKEEEISIDLGLAASQRPQQGLGSSDAHGHGETDRQHSPRFSEMPVKERLQQFSRALTERFPKAVDAFAFIDDDGSGALSLQELADGLTGVGITIDSNSLSEMMSASGLATRSTIKYKDFLKLFLGKFKPMSAAEQEIKALAEAQELLIRKLAKESGEIDQEALLRAFQAFDDNGDGHIDNMELRNGFLSFGLGDIDDPTSAMAPFKRLIDRCDDNGDGKINYTEFLEVAGFGSGGRGGFNHRNIKGGGASQGFRELNKFDAKILERERRKKLAAGIEDSDPDTPRGLMRWRAKYCKSFFGNKYITEIETASKTLVADKAEGRYVEAVAPWNAATRRYMEQVLKIPPERDNLHLFNGVQSLDENETENTWNSTAHESSRGAFRKGLSQAPQLQRVDGMGQSLGNSIPGFLSGISRQTGAFRRPCLLGDQWDEYKDEAIRSSVRLTHHNEQKPKYLHQPGYDTMMRGKTVKDVVKDYHLQHNTDFSQTKSLRGPVDVLNPFSRFGGQWTLHDTVQDVLHKSIGESVRPPQATGMIKPMVEEPYLTRQQLEAMRLRGDTALPVSGRATTEMDANSFMSQPLQRDLFCRTLLNSGRRSPGRAPTKK